MGMLVRQGEESWAMPQALVPEAIEVLGEEVRLGRARLVDNTMKTATLHTIEGDVVMGTKEMLLLFAGIEPLDWYLMQFNDLPTEKDEPLPVAHFRNSPEPMWDRDERRWCGRRRPFKSWKGRRKTKYHFVDASSWTTAMPKEM